MIAVFLAGTGLILLLYGYRYSRIWARFLTVRVLFSQSHLYAGQTGELTEEIENRKKQPVPVVEIGFRIPKGIRIEGARNVQESDYIYKQDLFAIRGMERIVRRYQLTARRRGYYEATHLSCHAPSLFFRADYIMDRNVQEDVPGMYVYAPWVECGELMRAVEVILGQRESARRVLEDPFAFAAIRDYTPDDPMKTINWKASARTGSLMVNTFTSTVSSGVRVFLDVRMDPEQAYGEDLREDAVALAASLIRSLARKNLDVSLAANAFVRTPVGDPVSGSVGSPVRESVGSPVSASVRGSTVFPSAAGGDRLTAIERFLASDFESADTVSFEELVRSSDPGNASRGYGHVLADAVRVYITSSYSPALCSAVLGSLGTRSRGILAYPVRSSAQEERRQEGNLLILPLRVRQECRQHS